MRWSDAIAGANQSIQGIKNYDIKQSGLASVEIHNRHLDILEHLGKLLIWTHGVLRLLLHHQHMPTNDCRQVQGLPFPRILTTLMRANPLHRVRTSPHGWNMVQ
jgi:hypothetical protein